MRAYLDGVIHLPEAEQRQKAEELGARHRHIVDRKFRVGAVSRERREGRAVDLRRSTGTCTPW